MKSKTWTPFSGMTERQIERELNRQMVLFDEECRGSSLTDRHIKFQTFTEQWFVEYVDKTLGKRTQHNYRQMTPGSMRLRQGDGMAEQKQAWLYDRFTPDLTAIRFWA